MSGRADDRASRVMRLDTLAGRLVLFGVLSALLSVLTVGLLSIPLLRAPAQAAAQARLADTADTLSLVLRRINPGEDELALAVTELRSPDVRVDLIGAGDPVPATVSDELLERTVAAGSASDVSRTDPPTLVETRLLGSNLVLVLQTPVGVAVDQVAGPFLQRLALALLAGLGIAAIAGALVARRLARPLRDTGEAARRLSRGERSLRVQPDGPAEVVEVAEALNGLSDALERSESRQRRFLLSVSHELRTPLTAVRGYAEALADGVVTGAEAQRAGEVIEGEAARLDVLMSDLLALARSEADDFTVDLGRVDLVALVEETADAWAEPARRAGIGLQSVTSPEPLVALADPLRLRQVLDALLANAMRVTPAGQPVVLEAAASGDGQVSLQVRDGGPGLDDDDLPVAFDPGVLRDRYEGLRPGGSGIGLALVERLTSRMGARVQAGHAPEGGAAFTVTLDAIAATPRPRG